MAQRKARGPQVTAAATVEMLHLDRQLCFLLYKASGRMTEIYRPILKALGLTYPQYLVMLALWERDDRTVGDLGRLLEMEIGTLSPLLKRMEAAGVLSRERDPKDERKVNVRLTPAGKGLRRKALESVPQGLACQLKTPIEDLVALHAGLNRLLQTMTVPD